MINKKTFIFKTLEDALKMKIGADPRNATYRVGSFSADAQIYSGEPDVPYYSEVLIRETNQIWRCNQFWMNDVSRGPDNDLVTERAERQAADALMQSDIQVLKTQTGSCDQYKMLETQARLDGDNMLAEKLERQTAAIAALELRVESLAGNLITMEEYRAISPKQFQTYFVARDEMEKAKMKCWRIYLRTQLVGEFESNGKLTLPVFPMRFPFRLA